MKEEPQEDDSNNDTANTDDSDDHEAEAIATVNTERFIKQIKNNPAIWDLNSAEYSNRFEKIKAWERVCVATFPNFLALSPYHRRTKVIQLQKRWKGLRSCFNREKKKQEEAPLGPRKEYYYFEQLSFLSPSVLERSPRDPSLANRHPRKMSIVDRHRRKRDSDRIRSRPPKVRPKETIELEVPRKREITESMDSSNIIPDLKNEGNTENDHDFHFLQSLLPHFKKVPDECKLDLQSEILHTLRKYVSYRSTPSGYPQQYGSYPNTSTSKAVENVYVQSPAETNVSQNSEVLEDMLADGE